MIINIGNYKYTRILEILKNFQTYVDKDQTPPAQFSLSSRRYPNPCSHPAIQLNKILCPPSIYRNFQHIIIITDSRTLSIPLKRTINPRTEERMGMQYYSKSRKSPTEFPYFLLYSTPVDAYLTILDSMGPPYRVNRCLLAHPLPYGSR